MARIAYAARVLLDQVGGSVVGDPDGFGVHRSVSLPKGVDVDALADDVRVVAVAELADAVLVDLSPRAAADLAYRFDLD